MSPFGSKRQNSTTGNPYERVRRDLGSVDDHVPGDPAAAEALAGALGRDSRQLMQDAHELLLLTRAAAADTNRWSGSFHRAFVALTPLLARLVAETGEVVGHSAVGIDEYADTVRHLRHQAERARQRGQAAENQRVGLLDTRIEAQQQKAATTDQQTDEVLAKRIESVDVRIGPRQRDVDAALAELKHLRRRRADADGLVRVRLDSAGERVRDVANEVRSFRGHDGIGPHPAPVSGGGKGGGPGVDEVGTPPIDAPPIIDVDPGVDGPERAAGVPVGAGGASPGTAASGVFLPPTGTSTGQELIDEATDGGLPGSATGAAAGLLGAGAIATAARGATAAHSGSSSSGGSSGPGPRGGDRTGATGAPRPGGRGDGRDTTSDDESSGGRGGADLGALVPVVGAAAGAAALFLVGERMLRSSTATRNGRHPFRGGSRSGFRDRWLRLGRDALGEDAVGHLSGEVDRDVQDGALPGTAQRFELPAGLVADIPATWNMTRGDGCVVITPPPRAGVRGANLVVFADPSGTADVMGGIQDLPGSIVLETGAAAAVVGGSRARFGYALGSTSLTVHRHVVNGADGVPVVATATVPTGTVADAGPPLDAVVASFRPAD